MKKFEKNGIPWILQNSMEFLKSDEKVTFGARNEHSKKKHKRKIWQKVKILRFFDDFDPPKGVVAIPCTKYREMTKSRKNDFS